MKEDESLINYLTNIILRPHRQIYGIQKLGPNKIVVKSHQKSIFLLQSMSRSQKHIPKQLHQNYCELIQVNRHEVTIKNQGKSIQASIYEPQLTTKQKKSTEPQCNQDKMGNKNPKSFFPSSNKQKHHFSYSNCVIFLHANSGSRIQGTSQFYFLGTQYAKHVLQYRTLCVSFDYTGSGISQGHYTTMGVNQSKDLSAVIHYIAEKYNVKKFSLWGRSMGAVTGIYYLLTKYKEDVKKIRVASCIIDSPFSDLQKLILEIASKRSNLPQFVFQPFMYRIEKQIVSKIGINIFSELNLVEKIKKLSPQDTKLLNSVSFLGLASKDDKMISYQHCEQLCQHLIPKDVRNSQLIDDKNMVINNVNDKHFMMLIDFKRQINTRGDFMQIQGDHNKPRTNEVKQKISFFIEDNFISYKDPFTQIISSQTLIKQPQQKPLNFGKTGLSIKGKLASTKAAQNNGIKSRKDSQTLKDPLQSQTQHRQNASEMINKLSQPQLKTQESINAGQNYNLINLKEIKAKQQAKKSLSKEKESIRNSLNKNFLFKERKHTNASLQPANKGLNIVSKEFNKERLKPSQQAQNQVKASFDMMHSSRHYNQSNRESTKPQVPSSFSSFMSKFKVAQNTPKHKDQNTSIQYTSIQNQRISQNNDSVNNSLTKQDSTISGDNNHSQIVVSALNLSQNNIANYQPPNLTQRLPRPEKYFESLPSERYNRNAQSQTYVYQNKLQQSPGISTTPFNLSIDNSSNLSFEMHNSFQEESFRKKQSSQILDATDFSLKKQAPKTPQVKISISEFRNRHEDQSNNKSAHKKYPVVTKKENTFGDANLPTNLSLNMNQTKGSESICQEDKLSSKHSLQFKKREPAETNSIHNSDMSHEQSVEMGQNRSQSHQYGNQARQNPNINHVQVHISHKHPNISNSFTQNNQMSMRQIMMNNGHKGLTQSSTFNTYSNPNAFYSQPQYPQYVYPQPQINQQQFMVQNQQKTANPNTYYSQIANPMQSMRTSQDQYNHINHGREYSNINPQLISSQTNIFLQNKPTSQSATYGTNTSMNSNINTSAFYNPNQPPKQPIEYKKKITRLLD